MQLTVIPLGTQTPSVSNYVAAIKKRLEELGVKHQLNDMGTLLEGKVPELLTWVQKIYEIPFDQGAVRVVTHITIDDRRDKEVAIGDKMVSVAHKMKELGE